MFEVQNNDTALSLGVQDGEPPMKVNSAGKAAMLNADRVDGKDAPLWTVVNAAGGIDPNKSFGVVGRSKSGTGVYQIAFNRSVTNCARVATIASGAGTGQIAASGSAAGPDVIKVTTASSTGASTNSGFFLVVHC